MSGKKISIITVCLNAERHLEETINSVLEQTYKDIEYIIIDGGSTDTTLNIINKYSSKIDNWISETDSGIAEAMNKGVKLATGDYILFIHSDDYLLHPEALLQASDYLNNNRDIYMFQVVFDNQTSKKISKDRSLGWWTNFKMGSCHQGHLVKRELFKKNGLFDSTLKICMDFDFILRCYRSDAQTMCVNLPISVMRDTGISSKRDWLSLRNRLREEYLVHMKNCSGSFMKTVYKLYWLFYWPYAWFAKKI